MREIYKSRGLIIFMVVGVVGVIMYGCIARFCSNPVEDGETEVEVDVSGGDIEEDSPDIEGLGDEIVDEGAEVEDGVDIEEDIPAELEPDLSGFRCGDGILAPWEECDEGENNSFSGSCLPTCKSARCGDGFVWLGHEYCDDGNTNGGDTCASDCLDGERTIETVAGGGVCDGLPAKAVSIAWPVAVAPRPDGSGVVFAARDQYRIGEIRSSGIVETLVGNGQLLPPIEASRLKISPAGRPMGLAFLGLDLLFSDGWFGFVMRVGERGIYRYVGAGYCWNPGDTARALSLPLCNPMAISVDSVGRLLIADQSVAVVWRVDASGVTVERIAGIWGFSGYSGDGNTSTSSQLYMPIHAIPISGNRIYITDYGNHKIRMIEENGMIRTVADGIYPRAAVSLGDDLVFANWLWSAILKVTPTGAMETLAGTGSRGYSGDGGPATSAALGNPEGVGIGGGYIYVADSENNRIRRFTIGGSIETIAGNGFGNYCGDVGSAEGFGVDPPPGGWDYSATNAALDTPFYVAVLLDGSVVWTEEYNHVVRIMLPDGTIDTLAGDGTPGFADGTGRSARFRNPHGLAVDTAGNILVADSENHRIRLINPHTRVVTTIAGNGSSGLAGEGALAAQSPLAYPTDVAVSADGSTIYVVEHDNQRISRIDMAGRIWTFAGRPGNPGDDGDGGPATSARFTVPYGIGVDSTGIVYVADEGANRVRRIIPGGTPGTERIEAFAGNGLNIRYDGDGGPPATAGIFSPRDIAIDDATGAVFIADSGHNVVRIVRDEGAMVGLVIRTVAGNGACDFDGDLGPAPYASLCNPCGIAVDGEGGIYIADRGNNRIRHAKF